MSLTDLWLRSQNQLENKQIHQIIAFAGDGKLKDDNTASHEFREFLAHIPSDFLTKYVRQCLEDSFTDSGYVLQDLVNQIGQRMGFMVINGRYRGIPGQTGFDGLWTFPNGHTLIVEVKTTDTYKISLETLSKYRREVINQGICTEENSSILIVLGRDSRDTVDLEAQIRGSRYAWNIRLISIEALGRLMSLKEEVEDPQIIDRISQILIPREFTKLDEIVELVFSTAADIKQEEQEESEVDEDKVDERILPVAFHQSCIERIQQALGQTLIKRTRTSYSSPSDALRLICVVSKLYERNGQSHYWFAFHAHQKDYLGIAASSYVAFGCGSAETLLIIPLPDFASWLDQMHTTRDETRFYWHVYIQRDGDNLFLHRRRGALRIDLNPYKI
jgi:hypothetical protein